MTVNHIHRLNLSATPFHNRRLFWLGLTVAFGLLCGVTGWLAQRYRQLAGDEQRYVDLRNASRTMLEREQAQLNKVQKQSAETGRQPTPEQARAMREALYLLERRQLSWSRLMLQMEQQLPSNIRILQIAFTDKDDERLGAGGRADQDKNQDKNFDAPLPVSQDIPFTVTVRAPTPEAVTDFIRACDRQGTFYFNPDTQSIPSDTRTATDKKEVEFMLRGRYRPGSPALTPDTPPPLEVKR
ncbi:MAG: hypothetical protein SNJ67_12880 [Chloracidobacterium sp.]|uniref:Tfp pilus assembly protein PilN n=1 Tax=Chloracidobacterium validum TaxID=2821543 RepID=A0ABX8B989_9BACT|nr:hypothetical protein [Chloracidobacterium validum]QUW02249.1 hypothetical protein J8C06_07730 [Chloracidobacterium validum]